MRALLRDGILWILLGSTAVLTAGFGLLPSVGQTAVAACWFALLALHLALVLCCRAVILSMSEAGPPRRFWGALVAAAVAFVAADVSQLAFVLTRPPSAHLSRHLLHHPTHAAATGTGVTNSLVLLGMLVIVGSMMTTRLPDRGRTAGLRFRLDSLVVLVGAAVTGFHLSVPQGIGQQTAESAMQGLGEAVTGSAVFAVGTLGILRLRNNRPASFTAGAGWVLAAAAGLELFATLRWQEPSAGELPHFYAATLAANALLVVAARVQQHPTAPGPLHAPRRPYSRLPYTAVGVVYLLLLMTAARGGLDPQAWVELGGAVAATVLVIARQLVAFTENAELLQRVDRQLAALDAAHAELQVAVHQGQALAEELHRQAFTDSLTGLPNRAALHSRLQRVTTTTDAGMVAMLLLDLDDFKPVNDRFGHAAGDEALRVVAARLTVCVRPGDLVARLGGDEFGVLLCDISPAKAEAVAARIVQRVGEPVPLTTGTVVMGGSVGVAISYGPGVTSDELLRAADRAMYTAKARGKGQHEVTVWGDQPEVMTPSAAL